MKLIPLTQGQFAKVDDVDFERFSRLKWSASWNRYTKSFYAVRSGSKLHREIMGLTNPNLKTDHINHDTLDCRRNNLRVSTTSQNGMNRKAPNANNTSGYRGVTWDKANNKWMAQICVYGKNIKLGRFLSVKDAATAYAAANRAYFGEFGGAVVVR